MTYASLDSKELLQLNSFGALRLIMATIVVFHHSFALTGMPELSTFGFLGQADLGSTAVAGFFAISGFLLIGSANRLSKSQFFLHRLFRIMPGFWFCLILVAFVIIPISALLAKNAFKFSFVDGPDSALQFVLRNFFLLITSHRIGDVFASNPFPYAINGSLWTLAPEFICYLGLLGLVVITRNTRTQLVLLFGAIIGLSTLWLLTNDSSIDSFTLTIHPAVEPAIAFCVGSILGITVVNSDARPNWKIALLFASVWEAVGPGGPLGVITLAIIVICLGLSITWLPATRIGTKSDVSYGIYLYHMPIMQGIIAATSVAWSWQGALGLAPIVALAAAGFGLLSWKSVEKPSIEFAKRLQRKSPSAG